MIGCMVEVSHPLFPNAQKDPFQLTLHQEWVRKDGHNRGEK